MSQVNDELKHEVQIQRVATKLIKSGVYKSLDEAYKAVRLILLDAENITSPTKLNAVTKKISAAVDEAISKGWAEYTGELETIAIYDATYYAGMMSSVAGKKLSVPAKKTITDYINKSLMSLTNGRSSQSGVWSKFVEKNTLGVAEQINSLVMIGYGRSATVAEMTAAIRQFTDVVGKEQAEALARTGLQHYSQQARKAMAEDNLDILDREYPLVTFDNRLSSKCMGISVHYPDGWEFGKSPVGYPPYHFNAVMAGEMVTTSTGDKPIEEVIAGDYVLTHRGRFKKVLTTMRKRNDTNFIRVINLNSGNVIRVTDEHPILLDNIGWTRADNIKVGDNLFKHAKQRSKAFSWGPIVERNPYNYPSAFDGEEIFSGISVTSRSVPSAVNLNGHLPAVNGEVKYPIHKYCLVSKLAKSNIFKAFDHSGFTFPHSFLLPFSVSFYKRIVSALCAKWVFAGHSFGVGSMDMASFLGHSKSPMVLTNPDSFSDFNLGCNGGAFISAHGFNPVNSAPSTHGAVSKIEFSLYHSESFPSIEMVDVEEVGKIGFISKFKHELSLSTVESISIVEHGGYVYNLEVEEDNSYLVGGVVTHNCRTIIIYGVKGHRRMRVA